MKTVLFLITIFLFIGCTSNQDRLWSERKKALESGIKVDTIMFGLCFGDSPDTVREKILNSKHSLGAGFRYTFSDKRIKNMVWTDSKYSRFYNDSLRYFTLSTCDNNKKWKEVIKEIYSHKYGKPLLFGGEYYWFVGNLEISTYESKDNSVLGVYKSITYKDNTPRNFVYPVEDESHNRYTVEYWEKNIKPKEDQKLKNIVEDI